MHLICPSEKRKLLIGEIININSPTLILTTNSISDFLTSSPLKIITPSNLDLLIKTLNLKPEILNPNQKPLEKLKNFFQKPYVDCDYILLDPELIFPSSPLFKEKYKNLYFFLRNTKPKRLITISGSLPLKTLLKLLKSIGCKEKKVLVKPELNFKIQTVFTNNKLDTLANLIKNTNRTLIICKNLTHTLFLESILKDITRNIFALKSRNTIQKRITISKFLTKEGILVAPKNFISLLKGVDFSKVIYLSCPYSIEEFIYNHINLASKKYTLIISTKDEKTLASKIKRKKHLKKEYLSFLNFLGSKEDKIEYLKTYLLSTENPHLGRKKNNLDELKEEEKELYKTLRESYYQYENAIDLLLGLGENFLRRGFGKLKGKPRQDVEKIIHSLVNKHLLGIIYFCADGEIIKKIY
ncbi:MAG: hypothetical protein ABDH28_07270 [Brevinematia bacterium]